MPDVDRRTPVYPIGIVERLTGLTGRQIRYYEEMGLLQPARSKGNRRLYAPEDVDRLIQIKQWLEQGISLEGVKSLVRQPKGRAAGAGRGRAGRNKREEEQPVTVPGGEDVPAMGEPERPVYFLNQAKGRPQVGSLYPVTGQAELIRRLERERGENESTTQ